MRRLIDQSKDLRQRVADLHVRSAALIERSGRLLAEIATVSREPECRPCPECGGALEPIERGSIGGVEYDYQRWCERGCGLYCYDRSAERWVKLV